MMQETDKHLAVADGEHDIMHHLGGYHRCCLGDPMHLEFAGKNFCEMLGYQETELAELTGEVYTALVHPDDTALFDDFAQRLAESEGCDSVVYRLIRRDGSVIRVVDTMASVLCEDGVMRGYSVVCEVPDDQLESASTVPGERMALLKVYGNASVNIERMCGVASSLLGVDDLCPGGGDFMILSQFPIVIRSRGLSTRPMRKNTLTWRHAPLFPQTATRTYAIYGSSASSSKTP
ncbi:MAG: PAS domain-containing protein [Collinsella sp.]|nr:PAS domain-containing protein [Collinsella sp.]